MSKIQVDSIVNKDDTGGVDFPKGAVITGVCTATSFSGDGSSLTGISAGISTARAVFTSWILN